MSEKLNRSQKALSAAAVGLVMSACSTAHTTAEKPHPSPTEATQAPGIGYDVSFPQCNQSLPEQASVAIVGLNGTLANNFNDCFADQLSWAERTGDTAQLYVHIGDPGSQQASSWPTEGSNKYGTCNGGDSLACDYAYGSMLAAQDMTYASQYNADSLMTWLDVEPNYSWQSDTSRNRAAMEGMVHTFNEHGVKTGIYSSAPIWNQLAGSVPSDSELSGLPNWVLGAGTETEAQQNCQTAGFTGSVVLAQVADNVGIDRDIIC